MAVKKLSSLDRDVKEAVDDGGIAVQRFVLALALVAIAAVSCAQPRALPMSTLNVGAVRTPAAQPLMLPMQRGSVRFAAIGDNGTGLAAQYEVAAKMTVLRESFDFDFVIMLGDNIYGGNAPADFVTKFERPYKSLLDAGVKFYASLGNHDSPSQRLYKPFNMDGQRYYTYKKGNTQLFALDSNYMTPEQLVWLEKELKNSDAEWKICYFHHPLYSSASYHGPSRELRLVLEPLFVKYGVQAVFAGHDHVYERVKPQKGVTHFVEGASGKLRKGNLGLGAAVTAAAYDEDLSFMLIEIAGPALHFRAISRAGAVVDSGVIHRRAEGESRPPASIE
jgi:hypothetical protein